MSRHSDHDGRRSREEHAIARAHHEPLGIGGRTPCRADTWGEVVLIDRNSAGVDSGRCELRTGILGRRLGNTLQVVSQTKIQGEPAFNAPVVLEITSKLQEIRLRCRPRCSLSGKRLNVAFAGSGRTAIDKTSQAVEPVRSGEITWEEIQNPVDVQVSSEFKIVLAGD